MSRTRNVGSLLFASWALVLGAGCDDPAPNRPPAPMVSDATTPLAAASAASSSSASPLAAASAAPAAGNSAGRESAPLVASAATPPDQVPDPTASADGPRPAVSGAAPVPAKPLARKAESPRTGILKPGEADKIVPKGSPTRVHLLDPGADPRTPLRYAFQPAASNGLEMGLSMTLEVAQDGRSMPPQKVPRIVTLMELVTGTQAAAGVMGIDATIQKVSVDDDSGVGKQIAERLLPALQGIQGLSLHYEVTPEGRMKQSNSKVPEEMKRNPAFAGTLSQMTQSLESMIAPFPDEPVGVGARWEVLSRFDSSGTELVQWSTFVLRERDDKQVKLASEVVQAAAKAEVTPPNLPPGITAKLKAFASGGKGESTIELSFPAPRVGTMTVDSQMTLAVSKGGTPGPATTMKSSMVVDLKRTKAGQGAAAPAKP